MDEELAKKLQQEDEESSQLDQPPPPSFASASGSADTSNDQLLAMMLQLEFDKEHDTILRAEEKAYNKDSKVKVSFEKFRTLPSSYETDDYDGDEESEEEEVLKPVPQAPTSRGRRRSKGVPMGTQTKHDADVCGRRNVRNMEKFPPAFPSGDIGDMSQDFRLPNSVFNTLRQHSYKEEKQAQRLHEKKEHSTSDQVLDPKTRLMLFKMVDNEVLTEINGCVSAGKEACVFHAGGGSIEERPLPTECAVKVFKTTLNEFKNRDRYIKDDYRFKARFGKQNPRKVVRMWAEKEMHNLKRLHEGGISCPEVVLLRKHVLIMSFIGQDQRPAPKLKEATLTQEEMTTAYHQTIQGMQSMYQKCHLVHADLSEYNLLWHRGRIVFIDVGQSVEPSHPNGLEFLLRDCRNMSGFFDRAGIRDVMTAHQLFNYVTGLQIVAANDSEFMAQIRTHAKRAQLMETVHMRTEPYAFDYFFEQSQKKRTDECHEHDSTSTDTSSDTD
jgi:RIO kinase 3